MDSNHKETPAAKATVSISLVAIQRNYHECLQRLADAYSIIACGIPLVDESAYENFKEFFTFQIGTKLPQEDAAKEGKQWQIRNFMRDAIELTHTFLEECLTIAQLLELGKPSIILARDFHRIMVLDKKKNHRLGFPDKIETLKKMNVRVSFEDQLLSINKARNCLAHRNGFVSIEDLNSDEGLRINWRAFELLATNPDKTQRIPLADSNMVAPGGWAIEIRMIDRHRIYKLGDRIEFDTRDIADTLLTLHGFSSDILNSMSEKMKEIGIGSEPT